MNRGDVFWIRRNYREATYKGYETVKDNRPALSLLHGSFAEALGSHLAILGTVRSAVTAQRKEIPTYELDFSRSWRETSEEAVAAPTPNVGIWKPYHLAVVSDVDDSSLRGRSEGDWSRACSDRMARILGQKTIEKSSVETWARLPNNVTPHRAVRSLKAGSVVEYSGRQAFVLSADSIHEHHPYGFAVVAPLVSRSAVRRAGSGVLLIGDTRIAFELAQTIQPVEDETFQVLEKPAEPAQNALRTARASTRAFLSGVQPESVQFSAFLDYLRESRAELTSLNISPYLGPLKEPHGYGPRPRQAIKFEGALPLSSRAFSGGTSAITGTQRERLRLDSRLFDIWVEREEAKVSLLVRPRAVLDNSFEHLWLEDARGAVLATVDGSELDATLIARVPLGTVRPGEVLAVHLGLCSPLGIEQAELNLTWSFRGAA